MIDFAKVQNEVDLLKDLDHPNVIHFHGHWVDEERRCFIFITELMTSGTFKDFIAAQSNEIIRPIEGLFKNGAGRYYAVCSICTREM